MFTIGSLAICALLTYAIIIILDTIAQEAKS
jgi:hypothetical protein